MKNYLLNIGLVLGIVLVLNMLSGDFFMRLDLTEGQQYTLSQATKDILNNLEEPVLVKAYFSANLPPNVASVKREFKDLLIEYANRSHGNLMYEIINPNEDEKTEKEVLKEGISPVLINVREKDQMKQQKAYLGAVVKIGDQKEIIPFMQPGTPLEYALSSAIKKISVSKKPLIGILQGQGEAGLDEMQQARAELEVLYELKEISLHDSTSIPEDIKTLALIRPEDTISSAELKVLDDFLQRGGNIFLALNRIKADLSTRSGSLQYTGLGDWLKKKGIIIKPDLVADIRCGAVTVQNQQGNFRFMSQVQFPYIPVISKFADHPAVKGLEGVVLPFVSPIEFSGDSSIQYTPLAFSSEKAADFPAPIFFQVEKRWTDSDFPEKNLVVAAAFSGKIGGEKENKIILVGNGDFALNKENSRQQVQKDNLSLLVNSIDWLSDDTGLISLRTKGITNRPLDELADSTKMMLKYFNFLFPIILILAIGFFRMQRNKSLRIKRMEMNYE
jgi:gliding-associated putative ABC transporter substrate-binding component GldG